MVTDIKTNGATTGISSTSHILDLSKSIIPNSINTIGFVYITNDYGIFNTSGIQRKLDTEKINKLKADILENGLINFAIPVNENYIIIDQHNLFNALIELKLPIRFYIMEGAGASEIRRANLNRKNWNLANIIISFYKDNKQISKYLDVLITNKCTPIAVPALIDKATSGKYTNILYNIFENDYVEKLLPFNEFKRRVEIYNEFKKYTKNQTFFLSIYRNDFDLDMLRIKVKNPRFIKELKSLNYEDLTKFLYNNME